MKKLIKCTIALFAAVGISGLCSCSGNTENADNSAETETAEANRHENAQYFQGKRTHVDLYFIGAKRISPEFVRVDFDLVNNSGSNKSIEIKEKDIMNELYAIVEGKEMPLDEIVVNGWNEKKRDYQYAQRKNLYFVTPDEWQPSMKNGDTYECSLTFKIPSEVSCINELSIQYGTADMYTDVVVIKPLDIQ